MAHGLLFSDTARQATLVSSDKALHQDIEACRTENEDRLASLEKSNISVVTTMRSVKRAVDALATKEGVSPLCTCVKQDTSRERNIWTGRFR